MADRTRRTRRNRVRVKVEEPEVVEEVEEVEDDVEVVEKPRRSRRERTVVKAEVEESEDDEVEDEEEVYDPTPEEEPDVDEDDEEESDVVATVVDNSFGDVLANLEFGTMYTITRVSDDEFTITKGEAKVHMSKGLVGKAYWDEVVDPTYWDFYNEWKVLTYADKVKRAKKAGVEWDKHDDPRVELMSLTKEYRDKLGIHKYKPQYRSRTARAAVRG